MNHRHPAQRHRRVRTVPTLFWHRVETAADKVAMREKDRGIWKAYTWGEYGERAKAVGMGLIALGLQPGERVAILSDNNKEWLFCDLGALCAAASRPASTHRLAGPGRVPRQRLRRQVPVRRGRGAARQDPGRARAHAGPQKIIVFDMEGLRGFSDPQVMSLDELYALGAPTRTASRALGAAHRARQARGRSDHRLHLRHHRPRQGRHADAPQRHLPGRRLQAHRPDA